MKEFPLTELARNSANVRHEASRAPVAITERNKTRFVLMAVEDYDKLVHRTPDPREAFKTNALPDDLRALLLDGLDANIGSSGD